MSARHRGIAIHVFPPFDRVIRSIAEQSLARGARTPQALQDELRRVYPRAIVRERDEIAAVDSSRVWYVYRDGRYRRSLPDAGWWDAASTARLVVEGDRFVEANEAALALLSRSPEELLGSTLGSVLPPGAMDVAAVFLALLDRDGTVDTTLVLVRGDRLPPILVQLRALRDGAGPGRHAIDLRESLPDEPRGGSPGGAWQGGSH